MRWLKLGLAALVILLTLWLCLVPAFASPLGKVEWVTLHWSEGDWVETFPAYHFNIQFFRARPGAGSSVVVVQTRAIAELGVHVWHRNTGNIGISACGQDRYHTLQYGQLDAMAHTAAELLYLYHLPTTRLVDHRHWADLDAYGPSSGASDQRDDIGPYRLTVVALVDSYLPQLVAHRIVPLYTTHLR